MKRSIAALRTRINKLLESQADESGPPSLVVCLPDNGRGPDDEEAQPLPRAHRLGPALIVSYDATKGQLTAAELAELVRGLS